MLFEEFAITSTTALSFRPNVYYIFRKHNIFEMCLTLEDPFTCEVERSVLAMGTSYWAT